MSFQTVTTMVTCHCKQKDSDNSINGHNADENINNLWRHQTFRRILHCLVSRKLFYKLMDFGIQSTGYTLPSSTP